MRRLPSTRTQLSPILGYLLPDQDLNERPRLLSRKKVRLSTPGPDACALGSARRWKRSCRSVDTSVQFVECKVDEKSYSTRTAHSCGACKQVDTGGVVATVANTVNGGYTAIASGSTFRCSRCSLVTVCTASGVSKYIRTNQCVPRMELKKIVSYTRVLISRSAPYDNIR